MITISKAIEIINLNIDEAGKKMPPDVRLALFLSVQSMQEVRRLRNEYCPYGYVALDGEQAE